VTYSVTKNFFGDIICHFFGVPLQSDKNKRNEKG
jgi:hypothetical protein